MTERQNSSTSQSYYSFSRAQHGEDVWLYENAFYGKSQGLILETGALDGIKYSTSFFFESFANWTAIHIGSFTILD